MVKWLSIALFVASNACASSLISASSWGDARFGCNVLNREYYDGHPGMVEVTIPDGEWQALTFTMWVRITSTNATKNLFYNLITTGSFFCPEPIRRSNPDLLAGGCGYPAGTNLSGAVSFDHAFTRESSCYAPTNIFTRGVYTIAGWSSNVVDVILGGNEFFLGPGDFNLNAEPGPSENIIVDSTGMCAVAVSQQHVHQCYSAIDGVRTDDGLLTSYSVITNELVFIAFRLEMAETGLVSRADLWHEDFNASVGIQKTNSLPDNPSVRTFSSRGFYRLGLSGLGPDETLRWDIFDLRVFTRRLSDSDLLRVFDNGLLEIDRRNIPRFR